MTIADGQDNQAPAVEAVETVVGDEKDNQVPDAPESEKAGPSVVEAVDATDVDLAVPTRRKRLLKLLPLNPPLMTAVTLYFC